MFTPAALVLLAAGVWAVTEGNWDFDDAWVSIGFAGWALGFVIGVGWHSGEGRRTRDAVAVGGACAARPPAASRPIMAIGIVEVLILAVVVWAMVAKPGL